MKIFRLLPVGFKLALSFLTVLPVPTLSDTEFAAHPQRWGESFGWYPPVGALLGVLLAGEAWLLSFSDFAPPVQAGLLVTGWALLTGGLHLDGLLDSCDALFAPVSVERRLTILKDVHTGAFGAIGLVLLIGLKWAALAQLVTQKAPDLWVGLILAPVWGRWMLVWVAQRYPYARANPGASSPTTLGGTMRQGLDLRHLGFATLTTGIIFTGCVMLHPATGWSLLGPLFGLLAARWAANKLGGGLTGDVYGALCEVTEVAILLALAAV